MDKGMKYNRKDFVLFCFHAPSLHGMSLLVECSFSCPAAEALGWSLQGSSLVSSQPLLSPTVT